MRLDTALDMATDALAELYNNASPEDSEEISQAIDSIHSLYDILTDLAAMLIEIPPSTSS